MLPVALAAAILVSLCVTPLVARVAAARGMLDVPSEERRVHKVAVPRLGGIAIFAGALVGVAIALTYHHGAFTTRQLHFFASLLLGGGTMFVTGLVDDVRPLRARHKLLVQIFAATIVYALGLRVEALTISGTIGVPVGLLSLPLTLVWIVGVTNAFNLIDGLDGLASGIAVIVLFTVLCAAALLGNADVALVCAALVGAVLGFLPYNVNPARIFLGDSGSLFIGFMLAVLSVYGSIKSTTALVVAIPLFALAVPLLDVSVSIGRRWLRGVPVFSPDRRHIHHRLLALGLTPTRATLALCAVAAGFALFGLGVAFAPPLALQNVTFAGGLGALVLLLYGVRRLNYLEFFEAIIAVASGAKRVRHVINHQIRSREIANIVAHAESLTHLNAILEDGADDLGFMALQVVHPYSHDGWVTDGRVRRLWKMEYPVTSEATPEDALLVLRITCDLAAGARPYAAERVTRIIGPVIQLWLADRGLVAAPASVQPGRGPTPRDGAAIPPLTPPAPLLASARD